MEIMRDSTRSRNPKNPCRGQSVCGLAASSKVMGLGSRLSECVQMQVPSDFDVTERPRPPFRGVLAEGLLGATVLNNVGPSRNRRRKLREEKRWAGKKCQTEVVNHCERLRKITLSQQGKGRRGTIKEGWDKGERSVRRREVGEPKKKVVM